MRVAETAMEDQAGGGAGASKQSLSHSHSNSFGGWLQRVRRTGAHSDIVVRVGSAGFNLHLLPLKNASSFFRDLQIEEEEPSKAEKEEEAQEQAQHSQELSSEEDEEHHQEVNEEIEEHKEEEKEETKPNPVARRTRGGIAELDLGDFLLGGAAALSSAADFCYLIKPALTFSDVARVRSVAAQLGMPDLADATKKFLYANVFSHWRSCAGFLRHYAHFGDAAVDTYVESRCLKIIAAALTKAFADTKHVSVPLPRSNPPPPTTAASRNPAPRIASERDRAPPLSTSASSNPCSSSSSSAAAARSATNSSATATAATWHCSSSPSGALAEILVTVAAALPDLYMRSLLETLLEAEVNLGLKCRQGRNVRAWLAHLLRDECGLNERARAWILLALAEMLLRRASSLELSSQYWCSLLEHVEEILLRRPSSSRSRDEGGRKPEMGDEIAARLRRIQARLEERIGASLHELDDYLHSYRFSAPTLLSLVRHFVASRASDRKDRESLEQLEEVAAEVDGCLWMFADEAPAAITPSQFVAIFSAFPEQCRASHDSLYASIDRMLAKSSRGSSDEIQSLWRLVDCDKLSPAVHDQALNNPSFLCQPHVLERVLRIHSEELAAMADEGDRHNLRSIMHKVIKASLKLLEENSRRSKEIIQLQTQYSALLGFGTKNSTAAAKSDRPLLHLSSSDTSPDHHCLRVIHPQEQELLQDDDDDLSTLPFKKKIETEDENEDEHVVGVVQAPQTPMVEARRSHCLAVGQILAS